LVVEVISLFNTTETNQINFTLFTLFFK